MRTVRTLLLFLFTCLSLSAQSISGSGTSTISGSVVIGNVTNLPLLGMYYTSFREQTGIILSNSVNGGYSTIAGWTNWAFIHGTVRNNQCWTSNYDMTGFAVVGSQNPTNSGMSGFAHLEVISLHCALTSQDSQLHVGDYGVWQDRTGAMITNSVAAIFNSTSNKLTLAQFSNAFPATIAPFQMLPPNWANYSPFAAYGLLNPSSGFIETHQALFLRANSNVETNAGYSWGASIVVWDEGLGAEYGCCAINGADATCGCATVYTETNVTGGDSGSPLFVPVNNKMTLVSEIDVDEGVISTGGISSHWFQGQPIPEASNWIALHAAPDVLYYADMSYFTFY